MVLFSGIVLLATCLFHALDVSNGSVKKGLAVYGGKDGRNFHCDDIKVFGSNISWWYDWRVNYSYYHQHTNCSHIDDYLWNHVPMVWGWYPATHHVVVPANSIAVLGFNEPNHHEQSNLTPQQAASHWPEIEKRTHGLPLVSPSASPCGSPDCHGNTIQWFDAFFQHCTNCRVDYLATHVYNCNAASTMHILKDLYDRYNRTIWLTEFACPSTHDATKPLKFMQDILPRLEAAHYIARYAWYMSRITTSGWISQSASLLHAHSSTLTTLGHYYNNFHGNGHTNPAVVG